MSKRLYLGRLPPDARQEDVSKLFEGYGNITDCRVMSGKGFGFVEFENSRDAEECVQMFNGKPLMGQPIVVEFAKESRPRRQEFEDRSYGPPRGGGGGRRPPGIRLVVTGISRDTSWQDLKDFGREAGNVTYADIDRDHPGDGILEYPTRDDADNAVKILDGKDLRGQSVRVALSEDRGGIPERGGRDDRYREDRYRDDRGPPRRDRSRSPGRRGGPEHYDRERRPRSPPRRERSPPRDFDDRRPPEYERRYDERRNGPPADFDRRRDRDDRRDDRGRANGDGGWGGRPQ